MAPGSNSSSSSSQELSPSLPPSHPPIPLSTSIILDKFTPPTPPNDKITLRFTPIGSTPSITPNVLKISGDRTMVVISQFISKKLKTKNVHLYIQNTFEPTPDELVYDLFRLFKTNNELIISYCLQVAFG